MKLASKRDCWRTFRIMSPKKRADKLSGIFFCKTRNNLYNILHCFWFTFTLLGILHFWSLWHILFGYNICKHQKHSETSIFHDLSIASTNELRINIWIHKVGVFSISTDNTWYQLSKRLCVCDYSFILDESDLKHSNITICWIFFTISLLWEQYNDET